MTLKVANIIEEGRLAGPQVRIAEVARCLAGIGKGKIHTTVIFPFEGGEPFKQRLDGYSVDYRQIRLHRPARNKKYLVRYLLFFIPDIHTIYKVLKGDGIDLVHVSGGSWQVKGVIAGKLAGCRVLWHLNDTGMPRGIRLCFRIVANRGVDGFIVAGKKVREYYLKKIGIGRARPVFEIQAPVDCTYYDPAVVTPDRLVSKDPGLKIVTVGNINPLKGIEYFLKMAHELNKQYNNIHFFVVGPQLSSQKEYLAYLYKLKEDLHLDNVTFYGPCPVVRRVLKAADIYVCSSVTEASPLAVWEAMAMETPVVSSDVGDVSRFVRHGESGYVVSAGDVDSMALHTAKLIEDKGLRCRFATKSRRTAVEKLDISIAARKHEQAYFQCYSS